MEEYEDMKSDAFDALSALNAHDPTATTEGQEHKATSQNGQMIRQCYDSGWEYPHHQMAPTDCN